MATILPDYLGREVVQTTISIRKAGDGLSKGLAIQPQVLEPGSTVHVVLECKVSAHDHKLLPELNRFALEQVLDAGTGTIIDSDVVRDAIDAQARRIREAEEARTGAQRLPGVDPTVADMEAAHAAGDHKRLRAGCPACDAERQARDAERAAKKPAVKKSPAKRGGLRSLPAAN